MYIELLFHYQGHLSDLEDRIVALANELEEYKIIQSLPGIGEKIAATIISEIGEIDRFNHPKKLVAFAGVDLSVHASGKFTATINRITKRFEQTTSFSVSCRTMRIRSSRTKSLKHSMIRKIRRKPAKVSIVACIISCFIDLCLKN